MKLAYHVEERRIDEEGSSPKYAPVHGGSKIRGCGSGDTDDRLHGGIEVKKLGRLIHRSCNGAEEGAMAWRKEQHSL